MPLLLKKPRTDAPAVPSEAVASQDTAESGGIGLAYSDSESEG